MKSLFCTVALACVWGLTGHASAESMYVNMRTYNGHFVCAERGGGFAQPLVANRSQALSWETFELVDLNGGELQYGDPLAFRTWNGYYLGMESPGGARIVTDRTWRGEWETFWVYDPNDLADRSIINPDDPVCFQTFFGRFVYAQYGGGDIVDGRALAANQWETFFLDFLSLSDEAEEGPFPARPLLTPKQTLVGSIPANERWNLTGSLTVYGANGPLRDMVAGGLLRITDRKAKRIGRSRTMYLDFSATLSTVKNIAPNMVEIFTSKAKQYAIDSDGGTTLVTGRARIRLIDRGNPLNGPDQRDYIEIRFTPSSSEPLRERRLAQRRIKCRLHVGNFEFRRNF